MKEITAVEMSGKRLNLPFPVEFEDEELRLESQSRYPHSADASVALMLTIKMIKHLQAEINELKGVKNGDNSTENNGSV